MWRWTARRLISFRHAARGLATLIRNEPNARIHIVAVGLVIAVSWWLELDRASWGLVTLCIAMVLITETVNTAIELLCDHVTPEQHPMVKKIKDLSAAAVLIAAVASVLIACCVFIPKLTPLLNN